MSCNRSVRKVVRDEQAHFPRCLSDQAGGFGREGISQMRLAFSFWKVGLRCTIAELLAPTRRRKILRRISRGAALAHEVNHPAIMSAKNWHDHYRAFFCRTSVREEHGHKQNLSLGKTHAGRLVLAVNRVAESSSPDNSVHGELQGCDGYQCFLVRIVVHA